MELGLFEIFCDIRDHSKCTHSDRVHIAVHTTDDNLLFAGRDNRFLGSCFVQEGIGDDLWFEIGL